MRKHLCLASAVTALALAIALIGESPAPALAHPQGPNVPYTVSAEDEWGNALRTFHKDGQTFLLGTYGRRYNLRIRNQTGARVEAVVSVDGRDVVSGRIGDFVQERGYVLDPYGSLVIEGFRKSLEEVAAFRFSEPSESYSARIGTPENVGVIGVAFFPERPRPVYRQRMPMRSAPRRESWDEPRSYGREKKSASGYGGSGVGTSAQGVPAPSAAEAERSAPRDRADKGYADDSLADVGEGSVNNLGTQYGEARESHVQEVAFRRADATHPQQVIALRYDDEQGLLTRGIQLYEPPVVSYDAPSPFPRNRFAPPPP